MASSKGEEPRRKGSMPDGVRGPGGPPSPQPAKRPPQGITPRDTSSMAPTPFRRRLESFSYPLLQRLHAMPRWIIVIAPAVLLFLGLILSGPIAWLGGLCLLLVWAFVAWLTALSWPALSPGSKVFRLIVVLALLGVVVVKFLGRF